MAEEKVVESVKEEKKEVATQTQATPSRNMVADFEHGGIFNSSDSFKLARNMAQALSQSTIVPDTFRRSEANCMVAISQAQKLGVDPFVVMNNMYMIQGKITWKSEFIIAMINASGKFDTELQYEEEEKDGKPYSCTCFSFKDGRKVTGVKVTMDMAKAEGWLDKSGSKWKTIPQLMLRYRAATFFARYNAPELTSGLYTVEEANDVTFRNNKVKRSTNLNDLVEEENIIDAEVIIEDAE